jgi:hypothetical protein
MDKFSRKCFFDIIAAAAWCNDANQVSLEEKISENLGFKT